MTQVVRFQRLLHGEGLPLPTYQSMLAAGVDLAAAIPAFQPIVIVPGEIKVVPTGFNVAIPPGFEGQVRPRSGLACKHGVTLANSPGTIDADYRGEIKCFLINHGVLNFVVNRGDRIAQMVIVPVTQAIMMEVPELDDTVRGAGGFGSTGV